MYVMDNLTEISVFLFGVIFARPTGTVLFLFYAISLIYVILYIKNKFALMWILPVSFLITPLSAFIYETLNPQTLVFLYVIIA